MWAKDTLDNIRLHHDSPNHRLFRVLQSLQLGTSKATQLQKVSRTPHWRAVTTPFINHLSQGISESKAGQSHSQHQPKIAQLQNNWVYEDMVFSEIQPGCSQGVWFSSHGHLSFDSRCQLNIDIDIRNNGTSNQLCDSKSAFRSIIHVILRVLLKKRRSEGYTVTYCQKVKILATSNNCKSWSVWKQLGMLAQVRNTGTTKWQLNVCRPHGSNRIKCPAPSKVA
jgi:hypothetical protein